MQEELRANPKTLAIRSPSIGIVGSLLWLVSFAFWLVMWFINPYSTETTSEIITTPGVIMVVLCVVGAAVSIKNRPVLMALISLASFLPIGWYLLGTPGVFKMIGWLNLACFFVALYMAYRLRVERLDTIEDGSPSGDQ